MGAVVGGEHLLEILARHRIGLASGDRVAGDAALEIDQPAGCRSSSPSPKSISAVIVARLDVGDLELRTLASSQRWPEAILIWLPTWPDMAMDGSGSLPSSTSRRPTISTEAPLPPTSTI